MANIIHFIIFRKNIYVWNLSTRELLKILDAHFGRIISLEALTIGNWNSVSYLLSNNLHMIFSDIIKMKLLTRHATLKELNASLPISELSRQDTKESFEL